MGKLQGRAS